MEYLCLLLHPINEHKAHATRPRLVNALNDGYKFRTEYAGDLQPAVGHIVSDVAPHVADLYEVKRVIIVIPGSALDDAIKNAAADTVTNAILIVSKISTNW